jgi:phosphate transport system protein
MSRPVIGMDLERIRTLLLQMCSRAESMVQQAARSVIQHDTHLARSVLAADAAIDDLELEIDGLCVRYLAVHKPTGYELRMVTTILKIVTDLERMGDLAGNIASRTLDIGTAPGLEPGPEIVELARRATEMIRIAADGFVRDDVGACDVLRARDAELDQLNRDAFTHWLSVVQAHPDQANRALAYSSICRYLERIGDHAVNIGQMIVLLVEGRDVRHGG